MGPRTAPPAWPRDATRCDPHVLKEDRILEKMRSSDVGTFAAACGSALLHPQGAPPSFPLAMPASAPSTTLHLCHSCHLAPLSPEAVDLVKRGRCGHVSGTVNSGWSCLSNRECWHHSVPSSDTVTCPQPPSSRVPAFPSSEDVLTRPLTLGPCSHPEPLSVACSSLVF